MLLGLSDAIKGYLVLLRLSDAVRVPCQVNRLRIVRCY